MNNSRAREMYLLYQCGTPNPQTTNTELDLPAGTKVFEIPLVSVAVTDSNAAAFLVSFVAGCQPRQFLLACLFGCPSKNPASSGLFINLWPFGHEPAKRRMYLVLRVYDSASTAQQDRVPLLCSCSLTCVHHPLLPVMQGELGLIDRVAFASKYSFNSCLQAIKGRPCALTALCTHSDPCLQPVSFCCTALSVLFQLPA